jgi:hypothetical protein
LRASLHRFCIFFFAALASTCTSTIHRTYCNG